MCKHIGIITLQGDNYGAVLQAFALNKFLNSQGYRAENIDYNDLSRVSNSLSFKSKVKNIIWTKLVLKLIVGNRKKEKFSAFRSANIIFSDKKWSTKESIVADPPQYDVYISGSDQIWNPDVMRDDYNYLLAFAPAYAKKLSYASSFGKSEIPRSKRDAYVKYLSQYDNIAVREESGRKIVKDLSGRDSELVLDPTLLLTESEWADITEFKPSSEKYILCYYMPGDSTITKAIKKISRQLAERNNLKIINLGLKEYYKFALGMDCRVEAGPSEFVKLFLGAEFIVTNSFHGTAFSTNFSKKVFVPINQSLEQSKARHIRMLDYLNLIGMQSAIVPVDEKCSIQDLSNTEFDYAVIKDKLAKLREQSINYLIGAIENER